MHQNVLKSFVGFCLHLIPTYSKFTVSVSFKFKFANAPRYFASQLIPALQNVKSQTFTLNQRKCIATDNKNTKQFFCTKIFRWVSFTLVTQLSLEMLFLSSCHSQNVYLLENIYENIVILEN